MAALHIACAAGRPPAESPSRAAPGASASAGPAPVTPAAPAEQRRTLRLEYSAPPECPDEASYSWQVESRSTTLKLVSKDSAPDPATHVSVSLSPGQAGWSGLLSIEGPEAMQRHVRGDRCEDVAAALALITVLRLEPAARARGVAEPEPDGGRRGVGGDVAAASAIGSVGERAEKGAPGPAAALAADPTSSVAAEPAAGDSANTDLPAAVPERSAVPDIGASESGDSAAEIGPVVPEMGDDAALASAALPAELVTEPVITSRQDEGAGATGADTAEGGVRGELAAYAGYASVPSSALALAVQLELPLGAPDSTWAASVLLGYSRGSEAVSSGSGVFHLITGQLQLCLPGYRSDPRVWVAPCAHVRGGVLSFDVSPGARTVSAPGAVRPWFALGPSLSAGAPLSSRWTLRLLGAISVPLVRDVFEVELAGADEASPPLRSEVYRPEVLSFEGSLGVSYSF